MFGHGLECHESTDGDEVGMLPATDALLARSMSFAIGVVDPCLARHTGCECATPLTSSHDAPSASSMSTERP